LALAERFAKALIEQSAQFEDDPGELADDEEGTTHAFAFTCPEWTEIERLVADADFGHGIGVVGETATEGVK
jgi:hypothetical protein